ncbi:MAG: flagellar biosynthetic protein FliO [Anaerolineales bacterium]|nr:flagellar biosynthetic protein FliO [Anaerolineales bacterium]
MKNWFSELIRKLKPAGIPQWLWGVILLVVIITGALIIQQISSPTVSERANVSATGSAGLILDIILKSTFLLGLIFIGLYFMRRWQSGSVGAGSRQLQILESKHLSPKQAVHLIRAGKRVFLIGATDHGLSLLSELQSERKGSSGQESGSSFAQELARSAEELETDRFEDKIQEVTQGFQQE